jgi:SAM-dependent methyltransferase
MALAGGFLNSLEEVNSEISYDLEVVICNDCSLVQIPNSIDPKILFGDYSFSSSTIPFLVKHFNELAVEINQRFSPKSFFEIGCNDGILLKPLSELGVSVLGIDAAPNIVSVAKEKDLNVIPGLFNFEVSNEIKQEYGSFDVISASNAFPHNALPHEILKGVCNLLEDDGILILEIMYCGDLYEQNQWDTLYHEHLNFYSLKSLSSVLLTHGLKIFDLERLPMHGGSLRIYASKKDLPVGKSVSDLAEFELSLGLSNVNKWMEFASIAKRQINRTKDLVGLLASQKTVYAYGAAGKATMWLNACDLSGVKNVVDASPFRYGKYMPGTHTPIISPEDFRKQNPDYVLVTAWNYLDAIRSQEKNYNGYWITPLPELRIY